MEWQEILVETTQEGVEAVANIAEELGAGGVAIEDPQMVVGKIKEGAWDAYELPDYLTQGENALVRIYLPVNEKITMRLEDFRQRLDVLNHQLLPDCIKEIKYSQLKEEDWAEAWKVYYKPIRIGKSILIKPTWEEVEAKAGDIIVELDPGMAFGTGTHPTTSLCLEILEDLVKPGMDIYDVGTGSGILAIACGKLGARVTSIDIDDVAVKAASDNVTLNGIADRVQVKLGNLLADEKAAADLVIANIVAKVIKLVIPQAYQILKPGGYLLSSGIFIERVDEVKEWLTGEGYHIIETRQSGDWAAILAVKEA